MSLELLAQVVGPKRAASLLAHYTLHAIATTDPKLMAREADVPYRAAVTAQNAVLLAKGLAKETQTESPVLDHPAAVADIIRAETSLMQTETFRVLLVNTRRRLIRIKDVSNGVLDQVLVSAREVFREAIIANAHAIILTHNHPSGDPNPSEADIKVTRELIQAGKLLRIDVLDHIIMGRSTPDRPRDFVSLRELGYFSF